MPYLQPAEIFFTALIGALTLALLVLTLRADSNGSRSR
jgi:hypothetical protein